MTRNLTNCFYCQSLGVPYLKIGKCAFCGVVNPLYLVNYQNQVKYFCCGCVWWQFPRSEAEKSQENEWYQARKNRIPPTSQKTIPKIKSDLNC